MQVHEDEGESIRENVNKAMCCDADGPESKNKLYLSLEFVGLFVCLFIPGAHKDVGKMQALAQKGKKLKRTKVRYGKGYVT